MSRRKPAEDEEASFRPPKLPKTQAEKDVARRLIIVLEQACLETVKVRRRAQRKSIGMEKRTYTESNSVCMENVTRFRSTDSLSMRHVGDQQALDLYSFLSCVCV
jgi:hypothetical protein